MTGSIRLPLLIVLVTTVFPCWMIGAGEAELEPYRILLERSAFPENDETRRLVSQAITAPAYPAVETPFRFYRQVSDGRLVQFELRKGVREWYLIFRNQRGMEPRETYPLWGRGNWIIKKDLLTGEFLQAKIFLQDDEDSFVRIFPAQGKRSRLDVHLYGRQVGDDVILPVPFETLMLAPFARIAALSDRSFEWNFIFPDLHRSGYRNIENLVSVLAEYSDLIVEVPDAAVGGGGLNVFIENGSMVPVGASVTGGGVLKPGQTGMNCSGYVKWVVDGVYSAWAGQPGSLNLDLIPLIEPTERNSRNPWSASRSATGADARAELDALLRDPYFGLDWNRNLARIAEEERLKRSLSHQEAALLDTGELNGIPYRRDLGYALNDLDSALYQLAARRPGTVYLAAVNSRFLPPPSAADPNPIPLHQYWHVSILAPWFDNGEGGGEPGRFRVAVLDVGDVSETLLRNPEYSVEPGFLLTIQRNAIRYANLGRDNKGNLLAPEILVNLTRLDVPRNFKAAPLPEAR